MESTVLAIPGVPANPSSGEASPATPCGCVATLPSWMQSSRRHHQRPHPRQPLPATALGRKQQVPHQRSSRRPPRPLHRKGNLQGKKRRWARHLLCGRPGVARAGWCQQPAHASTQGPASSSDADAAGSDGDEASKEVAECRRRGRVAMEQGRIEAAIDALSSGVKLLASGSAAARISASLKAAVYRERANAFCRWAWCTCCCTQCHAGHGTCSQCALDMGLKWHLATWPRGM